MNLKKLTYLLLLGALPLMYACEGPQGEIGPEGPQGPQGTQGVQGQPGDPASAIQFSTDTISTDADGSLAFGFTLTQDVIPSVEKGVVLVYAKSGGLWFPVPGLVIFPNGITNFTYAYGVENLDLNFFMFENSDTPAVRFFQNVRIVFVPAANGRLNMEDIDYNNYEEVRKAYNLPL